MPKRRLAHRWNQQYRLFYEQEIKPRITKPEFGDGCTWCPDFFVIRGKMISILKCCEDHDKEYDPELNSGITRKKADNNLKKCIKCTLRDAGAPVWFALRWTFVIFRAVRAFGGMFFRKAKDDEDSTDK